MKNRYAENLLGAVALGLADAMTRDAALCAEDGAAVPAALVSIGAAPGLSIGMLAHTLALSHSATVRVVAGLVRRRLVIRRPGMDRRTAALYLTPRGLARRDAVLGGRRRVLAQVLDALPPAGRSELSDLLETMLETLLEIPATERTAGGPICRLCDRTVCLPALCPMTDRGINTGVHIHPAGHATTKGGRTDGTQAPRPAGTAGITAPADRGRTP
ncbi:MarR family transcriptional regulator [Eilatimonas milleporae]|nr:MarR family transcriptional regulator [Eilatimonas milleporae]